MVAVIEISDLLLAGVRLEDALGVAGPHESVTFGVAKQRRNVGVVDVLHGTNFVDVESSALLNGPAVHTTLSSRRSTFSKPIEPDVYRYKTNMTSSSLGRRCTAYSAQRLSAGDPASFEELSALKTIERALKCVSRYILANGRHAFCPLLFLYTQDIIVRKCTYHA
jgi:hypothetical protein